MLSAKQGGIKYHFWVFGMTRPGIEPWYPRPLAKTLMFLMQVYCQHEITRLTLVKQINYQNIVKLFYDILVIYLLYSFS